jgi:hypothetical protein
LKSTKRNQSGTRNDVHATDQLRTGKHQVDRCTLTFKAQKLKGNNGNNHIRQKYHERSMVLDADAIKDPWAVAAEKDGVRLGAFGGLKRIKHTKMLTGQSEQHIDCTSCNAWI